MNKRKTQIKGFGQAYTEKMRVGAQPHSNL